MNEEQKKVNNGRFDLNKIISFVDKHIIKIYVAIAVFCFFALILAIVDNTIMNKYDISTGIYSYKDGKTEVSIRLTQEKRYNNAYISDGKDNNVGKETENSVPIYTNNRYDNKSDNYEIKADIPYINIVDESNNDIVALRQQVQTAEADIIKIRQTFRGNNILKYAYTAYNYNDFLSFSYYLFVDFENKKENKVVSVVYNSRTKKTVKLKEYLKTIGISERKLKRGIEEISKKNKLRFKYNGNNNKFYITNQGEIYVIIDENESFKILLRPAA